MAIAYCVSMMGLGALMLAPAVFAFGLVAFGFLGMGPVTIAVDSYGPVTDNAQSIYELSLIETIPGIEKEIEKAHGFPVNFTVAKELLEENDGAGNTFKATAKPVLIGTAVVGATTMIFAIIMALTQGLADQAAIAKLSILHPPFLLGLITGGAVIYWFTGASMQAVTTGAYRAVEFIKANIKLDGAEKASVEDSKKVVEICTVYAQKGMFNIFLGVFFSTLAFAFVEPFFFIGYLISIALFGLYQAIFMANAGGAWDNAKKIVETELKAKGTELHAASVVGDTVGDPFKDTSSVAMNPVIKFTTLFGLLAVELGVYLSADAGLGSDPRAGRGVLRRPACISSGGRSTACGSRPDSGRFRRAGRARCLRDVWPGRDPGSIVVFCSPRRAAFEVRPSILGRRRRGRKLVVPLSAIRCPRTLEPCRTDGGGRSPLSLTCQKSRRYNRRPCSPARAGWEEGTRATRPLW